MTLYALDVRRAKDLQTTVGYSIEGSALRYGRSNYDGSELQSPFAVGSIPSIAQTRGAGRFEVPLL